MPQYCAVRFCSENKTGHRFPKDETLSKQWVTAIRRVNFTPSKYSRVCSKHFLPDDYVIPKEPTTDTPPARLKPNAIPSQFPWNKEEEAKREMMKRKCPIRALPRLLPKIKCQAGTVVPIKIEPVCKDQIIFVETPKQIEVEVESIKKDASVQCSLCECGEREKLNKLEAHIANLSKQEEIRKGTLKIIKIEDIKEEPM